VILSIRMPAKRPARSASAIQLKPLIAPLVEPVLQRLDRHEDLLTEMKEALEIQFKRTADVQAQLDRITAMLAKSRS
jgi:hypothetical protein